MLGITTILPQAVHNRKPDSNPILLYIRVSNPLLAY